MNSKCVSCGLPLGVLGIPHDNPSVCIAALQEELGRLQAVLGENAKEALVERFHYDPNAGADLLMRHPLVGLFSAAFADLWLELEAKNYLELSFHVVDHPEIGKILVTYQRELGKTPHQLRVEAEAETSRLRGLLDAVKAPAYPLLAWLAFLWGKGHQVGNLDMGPIPSALRALINAAETQEEQLFAQFFNRVLAWREGVQP